MLAVIAQVKIKSGFDAQFVEVANQLVAASRQEEGCLEYGLWRAEEPSLYTFVERYKDSAAVDAHRKSEHFRKLGRAMGEFMDGPPTVTRLTAV